MAKKSRILALDIGASGIKLAEFEYPNSTDVTLIAFDYREYGVELAEETRGVTIANTLRGMIASGSYQARTTLISVSGQYALTRFVPLPPVAEEESRVRQIVEFEARQNVPFPMEEVIWDYQLIANPQADELEVMFVVIKNEIVEEITSAVQAVGLEPVLVDVAPAACYNAARANGVGDDGCAMVLNLGDRVTNLIFADKQQVFARTIPIAGHAISQQIAKEFSMDMTKAEELKRRHGFVALGGAYAEPESEVAASVSKIVRNVMTRMHGEINRSIGVYRAQQKGMKPKKLYLTGGSSIMGFTDRFFQDKLGIPVEYLNPFQCIRLGPGVDTARLQNVAHLFSEVVGLGLRYRGQCAVEVSLIPASIVRQIAMRRRKPYFAAAAICVLLMMLMSYLALAQKQKDYERLALHNKTVKAKLEEVRKSIEHKISEKNTRFADYQFFEQFLASRELFPRIFNTIESLKPSDVWMVSMDPIVAGQQQEASSGAGGPTPFGGPFGGPFGMPGGPVGEQPAAATAKAIDIENIVVSGFIVKGHSLVLPEPPAAQIPDAPAPTLPTPPPENPGAANPTPSPAPAPTPVPGFAPTPPAAPIPAEKPAGGLAPESPAVAGTASPTPAPRPVADENPEQQFEKRLQTNELFDGAKTRIISYPADVRVPNLKTFTMQIMLKEPIEIKYNR